MLSFFFSAEVVSRFGIKNSVVVGIWWDWSRWWRRRWWWGRGWSTITCWWLISICTCNESENKNYF
uniref:Uncharacterized protein n=1 Tax=Lepeophtheirus salmonis TaxID=72036 RepID=A0A0K2VCW3_LEPSM